MKKKICKNPRLLEPMDNSSFLISSCSKNPRLNVGSFHRCGCNGSAGPQGDHSINGSIKQFILGLGHPILNTLEKPMESNWLVYIGIPINNGVLNRQLYMLGNL